MKTLIKRSKWAVAFVFAFCFMAFSAIGQSSDKLTDPEIASIAVTANQIDVDYGKIALQKASNDEVKRFAQTMINDHTAVIEQAVALAKKLNVTPKDNAITQSLLKDSKAIMKDLNSKKGKEFDKAYIDNEVTYHEAVISTIKTVLIPQTSNSELKELFQSVMPALEHHLEMAVRAQANLK